MAAELRRWLHLGVGAFHRAHQVAYLADLRERGQGGWTLAGGNLRVDATGSEAALLAQGNAYTLETVAPEGTREYRDLRIDELVPYEPGLSALLELGADPATRIVSCTVTEAGYDAGETIYGVLATILRRRRAAAAGPLTVLSCDNLRHNGDRLRSGLLQFLELAGDSALAAWTQQEVSFPNAMVDRITPRPDAGVRARVLAACGRDDAAAVMAEQFRQWVLEDDFRGGRPPLETVGVQFVDSVAPYEEAKIRILNASHSAIAWAGVLAGTHFIHEGVRDPRVRDFAQDFASDAVIPSLSPSPLDLAAYRDTVLARFGNAALADSNQRVAADSYAKLREFIVPTVRQRLAAGAPLASAAALPALFLAFLQRWHRGALPFVHADQAIDPAEAHGICADADPVRAFAGDAALWGELAGDEGLLAALRSARARVAAFERESVS